MKNNKNNKSKTKTLKNKRQLGKNSSLLKGKKKTSKKSKTTSKKRKKQVAYGVCVNLSGLYAPYVLEFFYDNNLTTWWTEDGNLEISGTSHGFAFEDGIVKYISKDKKEAELFLMGVKASMEMMRKWCSISDLEFESQEEQRESKKDISYW